MSGPRLKDAYWVRQSFLVQRQDLQKVDQQNRIFSTVALKFTDTTPGGNFAINPAPQFTRFADIRHPGRFVRNTKHNPGTGMGRYYSEAFDDNQQLVNIRFGVPQFNSLTTFFSGFYNSAAGQLARTGRATDIFYDIGRAGAFVVSIMSWQLLAIHSIGVGLRFFMEKPSSKFYYLKPAMPLYWNAVNTIVNHLSVNMGIVPRVLDDKAGPGSKVGYEFDNAALKKLAQTLPDIFKEGGGIDVYAMANRAQRLANKHNRRIEESLGKAGDMTETQMANYIQRVYSEKLTDQGSMGHRKYLDLWLASAPSKPDDHAEGEGTTEVRPTEGEKKMSFFEGLGSFLKAEMNDGAAFATFRVNATGSVQESFSNSVTESEIAGKINSISSESRSASFNLAGGNLANLPLVGELVGAVKSLVAGVTDQLQISGIAALGGAAFVDIPKHWQSSQADLPRASYTIDLVSPYGNMISQLLNIHIPLAMLLAGALPMSTGKQSYTSPFILELYDQGRCQTRLGMIDSLSITRGTGNLGFNADGKVMAMQVTFSIIDMSSILHMPISEGMSLGQAAVGALAAPVGTTVGAVAGGIASVPFGDNAGREVGLATAATVAGAALGLVDDETSFSDYMATLAGMSLPDQIYPMRRLKLNLTRKMRQWDSFFSNSHLASWYGDTLPGRIVSAFYKGVER